MSEAKRLWTDEEDQAFLDIVHELVGRKSCTLGVAQKEVAKKLNRPFTSVTDRYRRIIRHRVNPEVLEKIAANKSIFQKPKQENNGDFVFIFPEDSDAKSPAKVAELAEQLEKAKERERYLSGEISNMQVALLETQLAISTLKEGITEALKEY